MVDHEFNRLVSEGIVRMLARADREGVGQYATMTLFDDDTESAISWPRMARGGRSA
ncbi:hypothetical protein [Nocardia jiangxiensis]|uniref:hypothetical protein n=1 Tax=Nocardia jiangxiensis TaxID=282685 RepID=UPI0012F6B641|nr:hypothetical protein [Nocardia jiangxiensis]